MIDILFFGRCCVIFLDAAQRCFSLCRQVLASQIFSLRNPFKLRIYYNSNGREIGPSRTRHAKWTWKPVVLLFNDFRDYMGLYILMSIYHMYFIYIHNILHKHIYPPWSSHHIAYYCHRILQQYKYRCAFVSRLWYASGFLTRWTRDHWWHTKSHPNLWGDWYAPETFPDAHVIYHAAWRGFWWHRPPDYQVEAGPMGLVATVASRCIYNLDSLSMSNKWLWSGMIDMRKPQKLRIDPTDSFKKAWCFV